MTYRPIGVDHGDFCFTTDEAHRCDACRRYGLPIDDRDTDQENQDMTERTRHIPLDVANLSGAWWGLLAAAGLTGALIAGSLMDVLTRRWPEGRPGGES